jgi:hypothetical protein
MPLGKRAEFGDASYAGVDISFAHNVAEHMQVGFLQQSHTTAAVARLVLCYVLTFELSACILLTTATGFAVQEYLLCGFDFVVAPLVDPAYDKPPLPGNAAPGAPAFIPSRLREELMLSSASWGGQVRRERCMFVSAGAA